MLRRILILLVRGYRWVLSPAMRFFFGTSGSCRFSPTCSCYALEALEKHGAWQGSKLTLQRLGKCHPWGPSGYDPVPEASRSNFRPHSFPLGPGPGVELSLGASFRAGRAKADKTSATF